MARYEIAEKEIAEISIPGVSRADHLFDLGMRSSTPGRYDAVEAHKWFNLAAMMGNNKAAEYRQELAAEMSSHEIATAQREAREWLEIE